MTYEHTGIKRQNLIWRCQRPSGNYPFVSTGGHQIGFFLFKLLWPTIIIHIFPSDWLHSNRCMYPLSLVDGIHLQVQSNSQRIGWYMTGRLKKHSLEASNHKHVNHQQLLNWCCFITRVLRFVCTSFFSWLGSIMHSYSYLLAQLCPFKV